MSFPQRPPMGMPMPYGFAPVGMGMPMQMGGMTMMPMMRPGMQPMPHQMMQQPMARPPVMMVKKPEPPKPIVPLGEKPPVTTVFVGNITERAPDAMIRQMLQRCGTVLSWKRVQGASGKLQAFGFCEYEHPEATLRCLRLMNDWEIVDKKLLVKVDAKTKSLLNEHIAKKKKKKLEAVGGVEGTVIMSEGVKVEEKDGVDEHELDEVMVRDDRICKAGFDVVMREFSNELKREIAPPPQANTTSGSSTTSTRTEEKSSSSSHDRRRMEDDKVDPIHREIRNFRETTQDEEDRRRQERDRERERDRDRDRERDRDTRRRRDEERDRERERERERERARDREERERRDREKEREREQREKEREQREKEREEQKSRSRTRERSGDRGRGVDRGEEEEDEEEAHERRRLERRLREKEAAYQELLKRWEQRERKKGHENEKIEERENERKREEAKEGRRLKEFLEEYNDDKDDVKYYKGSALQRRLAEREKEMESDERDRMKERDELEDIRRRLIEDGHPDVDAEMARIEREREEHLMPRLAVPAHFNPADSPPRSHISDDSDVIPLDDDDEAVSQFDAPPSTWNTVPLTSAPVVTQPSRSPSPRSPAKCSRPSRQPDVMKEPPAPPQASRPQFTMSDDSASGFSNSLGAFDSNPAPEPVPAPSASANASKSRLGFSGLKLGESQLGGSGGTQSPSDEKKRKKLSVVDVFNNDDEDENSAAAKKRKLIPITYSEEEKAALVPTGAEAAAARAAALSVNKPTSAEEKRKSIKNLIEKIPTGKDELFAYKLDWTMVDTTLMDRRIKPWVNKKIVEYIGEDEPTLSEFICKKVMANSTPETILADISMVLDDEAEVFVVKMWRLLIYETEAKKLGLVK